MKPETRAWLAEMERRAAEKRAARVAVLRLLRGREVPFLAPVIGGVLDGWTLLVHKDMVEGYVGRWRVTRFDAAGEPVGHGNPRTYVDCLRDIQDWGGDLRFARLARPALME